MDLARHVRGCKNEDGTDMVAILGQPVARPAEGVIFLAHLHQHRHHDCHHRNTIVIVIVLNLVITELMTVGCVLLTPSVENAAKQAVDENYIHLITIHHCLIQTLKKLIKITFRCNLPPSC